MVWRYSVYAKTVVGNALKEKMKVDKFTKIGWWIYLPFLILTLRLTWEKIFLTWTYGQQNIGFSLAHSYFAVLFLAPLFSLIWTIIMLIKFSLRSKQNEEQKGRWILLTITILTWVVLYIPFDYYVLALKSNK